MKKYLLFPCLILLFGSCAKNSQEPTPELINNSKNVTQSVALTTPVIQGIHSSGIYGPNEYDFRVISQPGATSYQWRVGRGAKIVSGQGTSSVTIAFNHIPEKAFPLYVGIYVIAYSGETASAEGSATQKVLGCDSCPL